LHRIATNEAEVEHASAKELIAQIEEGSSRDALCEGELVGVRMEQCASFGIEVARLANS
jgi:hypothetical protein